MAAVLCGGIGKACTGCFDCVGTICMLPFKICGACCEGCTECCSKSCSVVTDCCSSNFCCYITVTCLFNIPPIVVGLMDIPNVADGCSGSIWLLVFWILCVVHIVAAFYMSKAIEDDDSMVPPADQHNDMSHLQQNAQNGAGRIQHLFCYDAWMAAYILVLFGYFGWMCLGAVWFVSGTMDDNDDEKCDTANGNLSIAYAFGWAYFFMGGCALCVSLCCGMFNTRSTNRYSGQPQQQQQQQSPNTASAPASASASASAPAGASTAPGAAKDDKKTNYGSATGNPTPVNPSAPSEAEIPVASATPI